MPDATTNYGFVIPDAGGDDLISQDAIRTPVAQIDTRLKIETDKLAVPARCRLRCNTSQSIPNGPTPVAINPSGEYYDPDFMHTAGSTNINIVEAGLYRLEAQVTWAGNSSGLRTMQWYVNNVAYDLPIQQNSPGGNSFSMYISELVYLTAGQYVTLKVTQNSGGALDVNSNSYKGYIYVSKEASVG